MNPSAHAAAGPAVDGMHLTGGVVAHRRAEVEELDIALGLVVVRREIWSDLMAPASQSCVGFVVTASRSAVEAGNRGGDDFSSDRRRRAGRVGCVDAGRGFVVTSAPSQSRCGPDERRRECERRFSTQPP